MQGFRNALDERGFLDLGYVGNKFTLVQKLSDNLLYWMCELENFCVL